ncbi:hypothetical protein MSTO_43340 [Mycobacterium stomatepiae]|uniref:Uncharacterized protein n=1 Tax=Mycobacterium stomatepiae TaxID=470076 RepID=A0A7I7QCY6_9MYCO|nr:hypothetical protein MSTO_43340 [Mycobacterium stomatepiae]
MLGETWKDQYRRLQRQYGLVRLAADSSGPHNELVHAEEYARDIFYHFCCDAFHLRDWIGASRLADKTKDDLSQLLNRKGTGSSNALSICADIANGSKHLRLTHDSYITGGKRGHARVIAQERGSRLPLTLPFRIGGGNFFTIAGVRGARVDGLDIANNAIADWNAWLKAHRVRLPK